MSLAWGTSWLRSWGNSWGTLTNVPSEPGKVGGGGGWALQQFIKRPWEYDEEKKQKIVKDAYRELVAMGIQGVAAVVAPYQDTSGVNWHQFVKNTELVKQLVLMDIQLKQQMDDEAEEEELLILMLSC